MCICIEREREREILYTACLDGPLVADAAPLVEGVLACALLSFAVTDVCGYLLFGNMWCLHVVI